MRTPLPAIAALVRAGAVERAWELFVAQGYVGRDDDVASQAVFGRLLKARGRLAEGAARQQLFAEAARAYALAHALSAAPYLAINAATLNFLAGNGSAAQLGARGVIALLDARDGPADTPYFLAATRAEALFLLGDRAGAERQLDLAASHDPDGWADRATTIAQFREIAEARGEQSEWLERFAPPASLHFAGHMGLMAGGNYERQLADAVDDLIRRERIGFAWGALAAGSDIVIAERLLAAGADVHAVLPCTPDLFEHQSVRPAGRAWQLRFHEVLAQATSVRLAAADPAAEHDPLATAHAGELAIGGALLNAAALSSGCCQLIVTDADGGGRNTSLQARMWPAARGPQHHLTIERDARIEALFPPEWLDPARALMVHVAIQIDELTRTTKLDSTAITALAAPVWHGLAGVDPCSVRVGPGSWQLVVDDPGVALGAILTIQEQCRKAGQPGPSIGAHIAIATLVADPVSKALVPYGPGMALANRLRAMAPPGLALVSDALAVTMVARQTVAARSELYHAGDEESEGAVHVLLPLGQ
ncbi:MAG: hypothetical protein KGM49_13985 [Sphingomonadales bacterium]|nr:hypothetical protein [Sphingomonadales bacterium]